jgi:ferritin-like metal-binding protein YciE
MVKKEKMDRLEDLYLHSLRDTYNAEQQITKALPKIIKKVSSEELQEALQNHLEETEQQINRLDQIFDRLGQKSSGVKCAGMEGLLKEGDELFKEDASDAVLDAGIIVAAQKVEHYEIAAYGSLCTWAEALGYEEDLELLKQTIEEEKTADEKLTELAEAGVNEQSKNQ